MTGSYRNCAALYQSCDRRFGQRGFTLLEVMVATVILGVGLATISGTIATTVRSTSLATGYENARILAESELALFLANAPVEAGKQSGNEGNVSWEIVATTNADVSNLIDITIHVEFYATGGARTFELTTAQLLAEPGAQ